jgi:hypothetical protein
MSDLLAYLRIKLMAKETLGIHLRKFFEKEKK